MLKIKNINKIYKLGDTEARVLKDISFSVEEGEFIAIMGPSGSGKSTLMNIIGCLDVATSGQYFFEDKNISAFSQNELAEIRRKKIGFVFQSFNLLPRATVLRNTTLPLIYSNIKREEREKMAKKILISAGLEEKYFNNLSNQLSGGQMQRVAIARALVNNPSLILADEPTGNLDSKTGEVVMETFNHLNEMGKTIILITHELYIAKKARRIISIKDGEIIEDTISSKVKK
jgi:putative ABC transport system ATP-binding protein